MIRARAHDLLAPATLGLLLALAAACGDDGGDGGPPDNPLDTTAQVTAGPYQLRATPSSVEIRWETDVAASSRIRWGFEEEGILSATSEGEIVPEDYEGADSLLGLDPVTPPPGHRHRVVITGLDPERVYHYRIASAAEPPPTGRFAAAPSAATPIRFAVFGDTRTNDDDHAAVVDAIAAADPGAVLHVGDFGAHSYDDEHWARFWAVEADLLRDRSFYPVFGNHEWYLGGWYKYRSYIGNFPDSGTDRYYAFDYGPIHGIVLDTEDKPYDDNERGAAHAAWLEAELERVRAREEAPILLVFFHRPLYTFAGAGPERSLRARLRPLFIEYGVDGVFYGHEHCYERFDVGGVPYVTTGGGGAPLQEPDPPSGDDAAHWVIAETALNWVLLEGDASGLEATVYRVPDGGVIDRFDITP